MPRLVIPLLLLLVAAVGLVGGTQQCRLASHLQNSEHNQAPISASGTTPTSTPSTTASPSSISNVTAPSPTPFKYGTDIIRGVNLGGWFVLEPWITPSIFENTNNTDIVDEYTFGQMQDPEDALEVLQNHWATWITEADFQAISAAGLNHVRIPLGYWSVPITPNDTSFNTSVSPYIPGAWPYLLQALNWAKNNSVHVILDLHGAPGSQNGFDNSGQRTGSPLWGSTNSTVERTLDIIRFISNTIGGMVDVIELLNEPANWIQGVNDSIASYWQQGYQVVREAAGNDTIVMIGDAFLGVDSWENFLVKPEATGVIMDYHEYQIFNYDQIDLTLDQHLNATCPLLETLSSYADSNLFTIIGEWSTAVTDCAKWLNGRGVGSRWDGTFAPNEPTFGNCTGWSGNMSTFSDDYKAFLRQYWEAQVEIGESIQGWIYWAWKAENADDWSYSRGLEGGWIPQDPTERAYPNACS